MSLLPDSNKEYDAFWGFIDEAIVNLEPEETEPPVPAADTTLFQPEPIIPSHSSHSYDTSISALVTPSTPGSICLLQTEEIYNSPTAGKKNRFSPAPKSPSARQS